MNSWKEWSCLLLTGDDILGVCLACQVVGSEQRQVGESIRKDHEGSSQHLGVKRGQTYDRRPVCLSDIRQSCQNK